VDERPSDGMFDPRSHTFPSETLEWLYICLRVGSMRPCPHSPTSWLLSWSNDEESQADIIGRRGSRPDEARSI